MKPASFDSTPEFQQFKSTMRKLLAVPKTELDEMVRAARESSPRNGNPSAPGKKRVGSQKKTQSLSN
jgi:hypothetical protein